MIRGASALTSASGVLSGTPYSFKTRFEGEPRPRGGRSRAKRARGGRGEGRPIRLTDVRILFLTFAREFSRFQSALMSAPAAAR